MLRESFTRTHAFVIMSAGELDGLSNLISSDYKTAPTNPSWLKQKTDTIVTSQNALPVIDLSEADVKSQSASARAQSRRIVKQAKQKSRLLDGGKKKARKVKTVKKSKKKAKKVVKKTVKKKKKK